jgi:hypothetical protein
VDKSLAKSKVFSTLLSKHLDDVIIVIVDQQTAMGVNFWLTDESLPCIQDICAKHKRNDSPRWIGYFPTD